MKVGDIKVNMKWHLQPIFFHNVMISEWNKIFNKTKMQDLILSMGIAELWKVDESYKIFVLHFCINVHLWITHVNVNALRKFWGNSDFTLTSTEVKNNL